MIIFFYFSFFHCFYFLIWKNYFLIYDFFSFYLSFYPSFYPSFYSFFPTSQTILFLLFTFIIINAFCTLKDYPSFFIFFSPLPKLYYTSGLHLKYENLHIFYLSGYHPNSLRSTNSGKILNSDQLAFLLSKILLKPSSFICITSRTSNPSSLPKIFLLNQLLLIISLTLHYIFLLITSFIFLSLFKYFI